MGLLGILGGGSKQTSSSTSRSESQSNSQSSNQASQWNQAYPFLEGVFGSSISNSNAPYNHLMKLLGVSGRVDREAAFDTFRSTPGYQFAMDEGQRAVGGKFSGSGLFQSGAKDKALLRYSQGLADQTYNSYLSNLFGLTDHGVSLAQILSGAGGRSESEGQATSEATSFMDASSQSKGTSTGGLASFIGALISGGSKG